MSSSERVIKELQDAVDMVENREGDYLGFLGAAVDNAIELLRASKL